MTKNEDRIDEISELMDAADFPTICVLICDALYQGDVDLFLGSELFDDLVSSTQSNATYARTFIKEAMELHMAGDDE